jgi:hypothetical protein
MPRFAPAKPTKAQRQIRKDLKEARDKAHARVFEFALNPSCVWDDCFKRSSDEVALAVLQTRDDLRKFEQTMVDDARGSYRVGSSFFYWY